MRDMTYDSIGFDEVGERETALQPPTYVTTVTGSEDDA